MSDLVGLMKKVVVFRINAKPAQGAGGVDSYSDLLTTRGYLQKSSGSRGLSFGEVSEDNRWKLTVRYQVALWSDINPSMKCVIDAATYTIDSWKKVNEDNGYIEFSINSKDA